MSLMLSYQKAIPGCAGGGAGGGTFRRSLPRRRQVAPRGTPAGRAGRFRLAEDLEALHGVVSIDRKIAVKRDTLIPKYAGYVARLREEGRPHELVGYFLVWLFDCGLIERALDLAGWCAEHGQGLPERFKASLPAFVARRSSTGRSRRSTRARAPSRSSRKSMPAWFDPDPALAWDVHDDVAAQFLRLRGLMLGTAGDVPGAVAELEKALARGAKVKTALDKLKKKSGA